MDNRSIGVFDSGVGGLTVLGEIIRVVPNENIIYFGDTARVPYGPRDLSQVKKFVFKIIEFLCERDVKLIVIACNTSTAAALEDLKEELDIPVIGVIEPGARTAAYSSKNKKVGVIATQGTIESKAYSKEIAKISSSIELHSAAAPLLVDYVEKGILKGRDLENAVKDYLDPLIKKDIDVLILGCTHFPLIEKLIKSCCGNGIKVISSAVETAADVKEILADKKIFSDDNKKPLRMFYETGSSSNFLEVGKMFLGEGIKDVVRVDLGI